MDNEHLLTLDEPESREEELLYWMYQPTDMLDLLMSIMHINDPRKKEVFTQEYRVGAVGLKYPGGGKYLTHEEADEYIERIRLFYASVTPSDIEVLNKNIQRIEESAPKRMALVKSKQDTSGYVYLVQSPTSAYKIGKTVDPDNRMKTFSVKLPFEVDYVCVIQSDDMHTLETELHAKFEHKRVNGEWFDLDETDVEYIKSLAVAS